MLVFLVGLRKILPLVYQGLARFLPKALHDLTRLSTILAKIMTVICTQFRKEEKHLRGATMERFLYHKKYKSSEEEVHQILAKMFPSHLHHPLLPSLLVHLISVSTTVLAQRSICITYHILSNQGPSTSWHLASVKVLAWSARQSWDRKTTSSMRVYLPAKALSSASFTTTLLTIVLVRPEHTFTQITAQGKIRTYTSYSISCAGQWLGCTKLHSPSY